MTNRTWLMVCAILTPLIIIFGSLADMLKLFTDLPFITTITAVLLLVLSAVVLPVSVYRMARELKRKAWPWALVTLVAPNALIFSLMFAVFGGRDFSIPALMGIVLTGSASGVIPLILLLLPKPLTGKGLVWKCPKCGALLNKSSKAHWDTMRAWGSELSVDEKGTVSCGNCNATFPVLDVYTLHKYDV